MSAPGKPGRPRLDEQADSDTISLGLLREYMSGSTYQQIADRHGRSIKTIWNRIMRARAMERAS